MLMVSEERQLKMFDQCTSTSGSEKRDVQTMIIKLMNQIEVVNLSWLENTDPLLEKDYLVKLKNLKRRLALANEMLDTF